MRLPILAAGLAMAGPALAQKVERIDSPAGPLAVETVATGLENPWSLAFLPDGRMLVTERPGRLRVVSPDGRISPSLSGLPSVRARGQGGLLDVTLAPDFAESRILYLCFSEARGGSNAGTSLARARLNVAGTALEGITVIFRQQPAGGATRHFGCRIVPTADGNLFLTLGDRGDMSDLAQDPRTHIGKVVRLRGDGSAPPDNPYRGGKGADEVWSIGHRNIQGAALHPGTGRLWTVEHGARGGDEINRPEAGKNYGWPVITYGVDYSGARIGIGTAKEGMEQPVFYWDPSIAPSGMAFYTGDRFPAWKGSVFVGALAGQALVRLVLDGDRVTREERLLQGLNERIRDVRQGTDGYLYLLTDDSRGRLLRIKPAT